MSTRAIMAQMNDAIRRAVLSEMRQAEQLAALAGRDTEEMRGDLERWTSEGRMLTVQHEGVAYFALFALNPADLYPKDIQILCYNCNLGREKNGGICPHQQPIYERPRFVLPQNQLPPAAVQ